MCYSQRSRHRIPYKKEFSLWTSLLYFYSCSFEGIVSAFYPGSFHYFSLLVLKNMLWMTSRDSSRYTQRVNWIWKLYYMDSKTVAILVWTLCLFMRCLIFNLSLLSTAFKIKFLLKLSLDLENPPEQTSTFNYFL